MTLEVTYPKIQERSEFVMSTPRYLTEILKLAYSFLV